MRLAERHGKCILPLLPRRREDIRCMSTHKRSAINVVSSIEPCLSFVSLCFVYLLFKCFSVQRNALSVRGSQRRQHFIIVCFGFAPVASFQYSSLCLESHVAVSTPFPLSLSLPRELELRPARKSEKQMRDRRNETFNPFSLFHRIASSISLSRAIV